jgi:rhodanese-related sulfurtransferase
MRTTARAVALAGLALLLAGPAQAQGGGPATGAQAAPAQPAGYKDITSRELHAALKRKDFFFVNVHVPYEGDIAQTDASIPFDEIDRHLDRLPAKDAKIVLYCRSDRMSHIAARTLVALGYTDVSNLKGGFVDWQKEGFPLVGK